MIYEFIDKKYISLRAILMKLEQQLNEKLGTTF